MYIHFDDQWKLQRSADTGRAVSDSGKGGKEVGKDPLYIMYSLVHLGILLLALAISHILIIWLQTLQPRLSLCTTEQNKKPSEETKLKIT